VNPESEWLFTDPGCQEEFRRIAEKLRTRAEYSIVVAGASGQEGVTTVALNLAYGFATSENCRTLVIDSNIRNPALHNILGVPLGHGLSDWDEVTDPDYRQTAASPNLWYVTAGVKYDSMAWQHWRRSVAMMRDHAKASFDVVFFDAPPVAPYPDSLALARVADGVVLVAESDETTLTALNYAREQISDIGAKVLGVVLNRTGRYIPNWLR
jgi:Mrp family chromosome partitioning ATPase